MWDKKTGKWKPLFSLEHLEKLPPHLQAEGERIRTIYQAFERIAVHLLDALDVEMTAPYPEFLRNEISDLTQYTHQEIDKIDIKDSGKSKERWLAKSLHLVLGSIILGHDKLDQAYKSLKDGRVSDYAFSLAEAGVSFGRLSMVVDLCDEGAYERIGSIQSALFGASLGGLRSGATRRKQSQIPAPEALRMERQKLVEAGKPSREISAILARKYRCTTDHIRKMLKRE